MVQTNFLKKRKKVEKKKKKKKKKQSVGGKIFCNQPSPAYTHTHTTNKNLLENVHRLVYIFFLKLLRSVRGSPDRISGPCGE